MLFLPCGHGGLCQSCAFDIIIKSKSCYLCRHEINELFLVEKKANKIVKVKKIFKVWFTNLILN